MDVINSNRKPDFTAKWFWDFDYNKIDWQASYKTIIARIIERGSETEWKELIRFYGRDKVLNALKNEIVYLPDYAIEEVSKYFPILKEDMLCYIRRQSRPEHWVLIKRLMADSELKDFFMVGGTALSLLIGHRISVDIDLFTEKDFNANALRQHLEQHHYMTDAKTIGNAVFGFIDDVKIDIIAHKYPLVKPLQIVDGIRMSSLEDIGAMKLNAIAGNGNRLKDFVDMYYLLEHRPFRVLGSVYEQKYPNVNIQIAGNSLLYFNDIDHSVSIKLMNGVVEWNKIDKRLHQAVYDPMKIFPSKGIAKSKKK